MLPKLYQKKYGLNHEVLPLVDAAPTICAAWFRASHFCDLT